MFTSDARELCRLKVSSMSWVRVEDSSEDSSGEGANAGVTLLRSTISARDKELSFAIISSSSEVLQEEGSEHEDRGLPDGPATSM